MQEKIHGCKSVWIKYLTSFDFANVLDCYIVSKDDLHNLEKHFWLIVYKDQLCTSSLDKWNKVCDINIQQQKWENLKTNMARWINTNCCWLN